jgi:uncharacterized protein (TIGR00290 family)
MDQKIVLYWSAGKDSIMALREIEMQQRYKGYQVTRLLTTLTEGYDRISGHGVRRALLERQAACLGLDLHKTFIPKKSTMEEYEAVMEEALLKNKNEGVNVAATGDIFVEKRRMATLKRLGIKGCFPLIQKNTRDHVKTFIELGFKAYVVCVDSTVLDKSFVGRLVNSDFLAQLPVSIDPCGENGEFHTFVFDGPIFRAPVNCKLGDVVLREGFYFCDVVTDD